MNTNLLTIIGAATVGGAIAGGTVAAGFVNLQDTTPGNPQPGHLNVTGYALAGRVGVGVSPTLAKVQAKETGGLQGVRAETESGTAVFGKANAPTGLAAGGYFTTASAGGRAIVGDALSGTGNTVGGLFYNRSTGAGVGVWGRAIGNGTATGVYGDASSVTGKALSGMNTTTGFGATIGTGNESLLTFGGLPRHEYGIGTSSVPIPVAYGMIGFDGETLYVGSNNWSATKVSTGVYEITITNITTAQQQFVIVGTPVQSGGNEFCSSGDATVKPTIQVYNVTNGALVDSFVSFVVYRAAGTSLGPLSNPPRELTKYGIEGWQKRDPKAFEAWRKKSVDEQRAQLATTKPVFPVDETIKP